MAVGGAGPGGDLGASSSGDAFYHTVAGAVVGLPLVELRRVASLAIIGQIERLPAVADSTDRTAFSLRGSGS